MTPVVSRQPPDWGRLYCIAEAHAGYFTTQDAADAGYSSQLLHKYVANGRVQRARRGVYRIVHFPATEHEGLVIPWLWSGRSGVFSHETALALHDLSDVLPARAHLTLPVGWRRRRLRVPAGVVLHHADVGDDERGWVDVVPVTAPERTLADCIEAYVSPDLVEQALRDAGERGLVAPGRLKALHVAAGAALATPP